MRRKKPKDLDKPYTIGDNTAMRIKEGDTTKIGLWSIYYSGEAVHFEHPRRGIVWRKAFVMPKDTKNYFRRIVEAAQGVDPADGFEFCRRWGMWPVMG